MVSDSKNSLIKYEIEKSDRVDLVRSAVQLIWAVSPSDHPLINKDLSEEEEVAKNAALTFLASEFSKGASQTKSHLSESSESFTVDSKNASNIAGDVQ